MKNNSLLQKKSLWRLVASKKRLIIIAAVATIANSLFTLAGPFIIGYAVDHYLVHAMYRQMIIASVVLLVLYALAFVSNVIQTRTMGSVGQGVLFDVRNRIFNKLQDLPLSFFNQNKAGDLISRINNDTEKLNQFFSETLVRFIGSVCIIGGAALFVLVINWRLGLSALAPAIGVWILTAIISSLVRKTNKKSLQTVGSMSAEIDESLKNFKVIVAFNRRDYFREKFAVVNEQNFKANVKAGMLNGLFTPLYDFAANAGQLIVLVYGLVLISQGLFTVGLLIGFLSYVERFYNPLRQLAVLWSQVQLAYASWDRVQEILTLESSMKLVQGASTSSDNLIEFKNVSFAYESIDTESKKILSHINFVLEKGKTYALVGPTGGGKTTTASLIARLYDPTEGEVIMKGKDIRSYSDKDRTDVISFILQDPFIFKGTLAENITFGNARYEHASIQDIEQGLRSSGLSDLMSRFEAGLETVVSGGEGMSLGQKQIIAFIRAILRQPQVLILDEATANIDTVTEEVLQRIIDVLPAETTKVIIAHRLNTIKNADEIFFVNGGTVTQAGSMEHALELLLHDKRTS
ncbi:MAG: hypothetical protein RLY57_507 [Candidatus Parcubacteria bacterium]|jgi:ATP-binding cassette subfamily B protein